MSVPEPVHVGTWDETRLRRRDKRQPGVLRILVGGQHAGVVHHSQSGWAAQVHGLRHTPVTFHDTAGDAITAVVRSSWARRLGYRAASRTCFSLAASRVLAQPVPPRRSA
jgi:hypothetical protein